MKKLGNVLVLATSVMLANAANAALIDLESDADTHDFTLGENHDYAPLKGETGLDGASVVATEDGPIKLTFEYLFKEADYANGFWVNGEKVFDTTTTEFGATYSTVWTGGSAALDFYFTPNGFDPVTNAGNDGTSPTSFWADWDGESIIIGLDDSGNNNDNDYDDLVVKVTAERVEVPEPATLALLGLGLAGLGMSRRKK